MREPIHVTQSALPPLQDYVKQLEGIWQRGHLTNNGPCLKQLEEDLAREFGVKHVLLVANATLALQLAIKALGLQGEIVTTPFSFIATTSTIAWEGCKARFADIDPATLCIDPELIEQQMHDRVSAIVATHVFGNPCDVKAIDSISKKWNVPVIYDAAHAYGVELAGKNVMQYGDVSVLSMHATKLFHSVEGGALATNDDALAHKLSYMRNFGFDGPEAFQGLGINAKMSELHAAMGLCLHGRIPEIIAERHRRVEKYHSFLKPSESIAMPEWNAKATQNAAYYPIILPSVEDLKTITSALASQQIFPRRYFYPSLDALPYVTAQETPVASDVANRILCLPLYHDLSLDEVENISQIILNTLG
ncbi:DegT/DnrJ/EryC1/StrS family aminotransferase [Verrucomicrobiaceae bacterium N1E253]|uniref:DegT/DnrJ/EryC1/StrS family aminotransferase n=1 Tax=Oceaniferula marina TaxID=2748318 RepID=A0A851GGA4_9BACT|nr:DegT/DnrJ/EryC1/StrS family aminotransferase [Oceaniferula marina]NWK56818.1 DegT/DnrJ/EryC1/StrS family aminotransferase [Oceaniferula marina]